MYQATNQEVSIIDLVKAEFCELFLYSDIPAITESQMFCHPSIYHRRFLSMNNVDSLVKLFAMALQSPDCHTGINLYILSRVYNREGGRVSYSSIPQCSKP